MRKIAVMPLVGMLVALTTWQAAEAKNCSINKRQAQQTKRINQGLRNGSLTGREAIRLQRRQKALAIREKQLRLSGGHMTPQERAQLQQRINVLSSQIRQQKHDGKR